MKLLDKWQDRGEIEPDKMRELRRRAHRLDEWRDRLRVVQQHTETAEADEAANQAITADEFLGVKAFDTAERERAAKTAHAVAARKERDRVAELVKVGKQSCEQLHGEICQGNVDKAREEHSRYETELVSLNERINQVNRAMIACDQIAESWGYSGENWWRLRALYDPQAQAHIDGAERLRRAQREFPGETPGEQSERVRDETLAVQTVDPDTGEPVPAYTRLPSDGGAVRLGW
jgi:hypothetical protein